MTVSSYMAVELVACVVQPSSLGDAVQGNANSRQPGPSTATAAASSWQTLWGATPSWASNTGQSTLSSIRRPQLCDAPSCITQNAIVLLSLHFCSVCCHVIAALHDNCLCRAGA